MPKSKHLTGLLERSVFYKNKAGVYEEFSKAEDAPDKILEAIIPKLKNKVVLDVGCGTGKYAKLLAPHVKAYYGLDVSADQLAFAKKKVRNIKNTKLICSDATKIRLPDDFFDAVVAFWSISTIAGWLRKKRAVSEATRSIKPGGMMYLIENSPSGEFHSVRMSSKSRANEYKRWLEKMGFKVARKIHTYFKFPSTKMAKIVFGEIWGKEVADKIFGKKILHEVVIFQKRKR
jgi:ubiquinone/menaquinone biosynthesis C-methylase UbiE